MASRSHRHRRVLAFVLTLASLGFVTQALVAASATSTKFTLTVTKSGSGRVASDPRGLHCTGDSCTGSLKANSVVKLVAGGSGDTAFSGWSGDCSGSTRVCKVRMTSDRSATATFVALHKLTVSVKGPGKVASDPAGIRCGEDCTAKYAEGTAVTLNPNPDDHAALQAWTGACSSVATDTACELTMSAPMDAGAVFAKATSTATGTVTQSQVRHHRRSVRHHRPHHHKRAA